MNSFISMGRATKDPVLQVAKNGKAYTTLSIAVDDRGNEEKPVDFFEIKCFGKPAEIITKFVRKGNQILVNCKLKQNVFEKEDGTKNYSIDFILTDFEFVGNKKEEEAATEETPAEAATENKSEIPF